MDMVAVELKIKKVLESRNKNYKKAESVMLLQKYGIIDKNQCVTPKYQDVVTKRVKANG